MLAQYIIRYLVHIPKDLHIQCGMIIEVLLAIVHILQFICGQINEVKCAARHKYGFSAEYCKELSIFRLMYHMENNGLLVQTWITSQIEYNVYEVG